jgi:uncharacterized protein (AIM24 family)
MLVVHLSKVKPSQLKQGLTYMDPTIEVHTRKREKSLLAWLKLIGGQSFWVNDYTATSGPAEAAFVAAPVVT